MIDDFKKLKELADAMQNSRASLINEASKALHSVPDGSEKEYIKGLIGRAQGVKTKEEADKLQEEVLGFLNNKE